MMNFLTRMYSPIIIVAALVLAIVPNQTVHAQTTFLHVDGWEGYDDPPNSPPGEEWDNAFSSLQDALDRADFLEPDADHPVIIRVRGSDEFGGIWYRPDLGDNYTEGSVTASFLLRNHVTIQGGYIGPNDQQIDPDTSNPSLYRTVLSGLLDADVNSRHVVRANSGIASTAVLDGFTVTGGDATDGDGGGGIVITSAHPIIRNCVIENNVSGTNGGGVNVRFSSQPEFRNCVIRNNVAEDLGGGVHVDDYGRFINCKVMFNEARQGGGIAMPVGVSLDLINCLIRANAAVGIQGIDEAIGGGVYAGGHGTAMIVNCEFTANNAVVGSWEGWGGGAAIQMPLTMVNCTFGHNHAVTVAGGLSYEGPSGSTIVNSVFWGNTAGLAVPQIWDPGEAVTLTYCSVEGGWTGSTNIDEDPLFLDYNGPDNILGTIDDDYRLGCSSLCINAGSNADVECDEFNVDEDDDTCNPFSFEYTPDLDLQTRISAGTVDLGAFEAQAVCPPGDTNGDGAVNVSDLLAVISAWGPCPSAPAPCPADVANPPCGSGTVDVADLLEVINSWGFTCQEQVGEAMPENINDCFDFCSEFTGTDWQKCMDGCIASVCDRYPEECE